RAAGIAQAARPRHRPRVGHLQAAGRGPRRQRGRRVQARRGIDLPPGAAGRGTAVKLKIFGVAALLALAVALGVPALYAALLDLDPQQVILVRYCLGAFGPLATLAAGGAALVPAALFGAAQLDHASLEEARARAEFAAHRLAEAADKLDVAAATKLVTRTPLDGQERLVLVAPSGTHIPDDLGAEVSTMPFVEI